MHHTILLIIYQVAILNLSMFRKMLNIFRLAAFGFGISIKNWFRNSLKKYFIYQNKVDHFRNRTSTMESTLKVLLSPLL